jgi:hypothetical protein
MVAKLKLLCLLIMVASFTGITVIIDALALGDTALRNAPFLALLCIVALAVYLMLSRNPPQRYTFA